MDQVLLNPSLELESFMQEIFRQPVNALLIVVAPLVFDALLTFLL